MSIFLKMDFHELGLKFIIDSFSMKPKYRTVKDARDLKNDKK